VPRPKSSTDEEVVNLLRGYCGNEVNYPVSLTTLYTVRNAVYKFNRENDRRFRCIVRDDGVTLTERPMKTAHDAASKEISAVMSTAKANWESDVRVLLSRIEEVLRKHFPNGVDDEEVE